MRHPTRTVPSALCLFLGLAACVAVAAPARAQNAERVKGIDPEINKQFADPEVSAFVRRFETDSREVYAQRAAIVASLGLKRGMAVADVGAGTGAFTRLFAEKVGRDGRVYAVDIAPAFLKHIADESKRLGQTQVRTLRGTQETTGLSEGTVDLAFVCDTYHHLEKPGRVLASIRKALKSGGRLVVVEFDKVKGRSSEFVLKHVRADKATFAAEIRAAGFDPEPMPKAPTLRENFILRFRKSDRPAPGDGPVGG